MIRKTIILLGVAGALIATSWQFPAFTDEEKTAGRQLTYKNPVGITVDEKGKLAYVALHSADAVAVVDLQAGKVVRTITTDAGPSDVALLNIEFFVTGQKADAVIRVDLKANKVTSRWLVEQAPLCLEGGILTVQSTERARAGPCVDG